MNSRRSTARGAQKALVSLGREYGSMQRAAAARTGARGEARGLSTGVRKAREHVAAQVTVCCCCRRSSGGGGGGGGGGVMVVKES